MQLNKHFSRLRLRLRDAVLTGRTVVTRPIGESATDNVFHCCIHKSGSQWIRRILKDARLYRHTGLETYHYQTFMPGGHDPRPLFARTFDQAFPLRTIVTPLYIDYPGYLGIPKPSSARAFFVTRDPRDVVVSWYFSSKLSHRLMGDLAEVRGNLSDLDQESGLIYSIRHLHDFGTFEAQRSWGASHDDSALVVRYEDLIGPHSTTEFAKILQHCRVELPVGVLESILETYSFEKLSGRQRGDEDAHTHFRKGVAGDWRSHFTPAVQSAFDEVTGDLVQELGYSPS